VPTPRDMAEELWRRRNPEPQQARVESLEQYLIRLSPNYVTPAHLAPLLTEIERVNRGEEVLLVCSSPPRGGKTETLLHALPWMLERHPDWEMAYTSYNATQARSKSRRGLTIAERGGLSLISHGVTDWRTAMGGGVIARGVGEGITGQGVDLAIVDDPHKDRADAESSLKRDRVWDWFNEALFTRRNPSSPKAKRPRSIIVNMARWHTDDLAGRLIAKGWRHINIPAIAPSGESFWPDIWPVEQLRQTEAQLGVYAWASLYMGQPRPRGGSVFGDPWTWTELPKSFRVGFGLDVAYSAKTSSDYSVIVVMLIDGAGVCYVVDVVRVQLRAPAFVELVGQQRKKYPTARAHWYVSTTERGVAHLINPELTWLESTLASLVGDKFVRAQPVAAAWNAGRVLVPADSKRYPWVDAFVSEVVNFTGVEDGHDDQVDALAAVFDMLTVPVGLTPFDKYGPAPAPPPPARGTPEWHLAEQRRAEEQNEEMLREAIEQRRQEREHEQELADLL
jgi:predicted phage terminase large subunit-like protein